MELSMSTIVILVLAMTMLVLGIILIRSIYETATDSVSTIDDQVQNEINDLFSSGGSKIGVKLGSQNTAKIKQGTENFGLAFGFSPDNPAAWGGDLTGCKYTLTTPQITQNCVGLDDIKTGTIDVEFDKIISGNGFGLIKLEVSPSATPKCSQRFKITVSCAGYDTETTATFFDIDIVKKGLF